MSVKARIAGAAGLLMAVALPVSAQTASSSSTARDVAFRVRGYVHQDTRLFQGEEHPGVNTFMLRRVRPVFEATVLQRYLLRVMPDFGNGSVVLQDAYIDMAFAPAFQLRFGKFKAPVGLERLLSATAIPFVERALPTALVPNRDIGVQLSGAVLDGAASYALGVFNGVDDGASADADVNNNKEFAARVFLRPFAGGQGVLRNFGFGVAATTGEQHGTTTTSGLAGYRSPGQNNFFSYRANVFADGNRRRLVPQASVYAGPFSAIGEYASARHDVRLDTSVSEIENRAWQVTGGLVLSGEAASERGVTPAHFFDPARHQWGAVEVTARAHGLAVDDAVFPLLADPARSAGEARAWGVGINWYLNPNVKLVINYDRTSFERGAAGDGDRATERVVFGRIQFAL